MDLPCVRILAPTETTKPHVSDGAKGPNTSTCANEAEARQGREGKVPAKIPGAISAEANKVIFPIDWVWDNQPWHSNQCQSTKQHRSTLSSQTKIWPVSLRNGSINLCKVLWWINLYHLGSLSLSLQRISVFWSLGSGRTVEINTHIDIFSQVSFFGPRPYLRHHWRLLD